MIIFGLFLNHIKRNEENDKCMETLYLFQVNILMLFHLFNYYVQLL